MLGVQKELFMRALLIAMIFVVSACTPVAHGTQASAHSAARARDDIALAFNDLFTYNAPERYTPPASERYCYRFASDVVCYDQPQPHMRSKLVGVQGGEGARVIVQAPPASVTAPVASAFPPAPPPGAPLDTARPIAESGSVEAVESRDLPAPFQSKESAHVGK